MICSKCNKQVYRAYTFFCGGNLIKDICDSCYPDGRFNGWSSKEMFESRYLAPDLKTVLTGKEGLKWRDAALKAQTK